MMTQYGDNDDDDGDFLVRTREIDGDDDKQGWFEAIQKLF